MDIWSDKIDAMARQFDTPCMRKQVRRDEVKPKLDSLAKLANDFFVNAKLLLGSENDLNKRITNATATNTALTKSSKAKFSSLPPWDEGP